jgi:predicted DCC family thiol-disulfide oxidoreductase YuxK
VNKTLANSTSASTPKAKLYFDGACPVCAREIAMYRKQAGANHIDWVDAAHCESAELGSGLTRQAALEQLHLRQPDGLLLAGAAAFTGLWQILPCWSWLGRLFGSGLGLRLLKLGYWAFLKIRPLWRAAEKSS